MNLITLTTDFGDSFATAQLHAVTASLGFTGKLIENHDVSNFSITEGAFQILVLSRFCPRESIHVGVVDPRVGNERRGIIIRTKHFWFVGPDNGLLYPGAQNDEIVSIWQIDESNVGNCVSNTFHGRDVFIKAAVYLAQGNHPEIFGSVPIPKETLTALSFQDGQVLHIDHYGNIKIHWSKDIVSGKQFLFELHGGKVEAPIAKTFSDVGIGKPLAYFGSSNTLELAINLGNAAREYGIRTGDILRVKNAQMPNDE